MKSQVLSKNGTICLHGLRSGKVTSIRDERPRLHDIRGGFHPKLAETNLRKK